METKEKKGFWASVFAPKTCGCSSQFEEITEDQPTEQVASQPNQEESPKPETAEAPKPETAEAPKCSCGGNC